MHCFYYASDNVDSKAGRGWVDNPSAVVDICLELQASLYIYIPGVAVARVIALK